MNDQVAHYLVFPSGLGNEIFNAVPIRWFSLFLAAAFVVFYIMSYRSLKSKNLLQKREHFSSMFFWIGISSILGARIFACLVFDGSGLYYSSPELILWPFNSAGEFKGLAGFNFFGGFFAGILSLIIYLRIKRLQFLPIADVLALVFPLAYGIGRLGNFFNGELWGRATTFVLGIQFPGAPRLSTDDPLVAEYVRETSFPEIVHGQVNLPRHPTQIYEALVLGLGLWFALRTINKGKSNYDGRILSFFLIFYGAGRFIIEYFKEGDSSLPLFIEQSAQTNQAFFVSILNISWAQFTCILFVIAGLILYNWARFKFKHKPKISDYSIADQGPKQRK